MERQLFVLPDGGGGVPVRAAEPELAQQRAVSDAEQAAALLSEAFVLASEAYAILQRAGGPEALLSLFGADSPGPTGTLRTAIKAASLIDNLIPAHGRAGRHLYNDKE